MSTIQELFVRLKAHEPKRGNVLRCYCLNGVKFNEAHGWYRVPVDIGEYLRTVHQTADDATSPLAFDVCSEGEALELDAREQAEKERRSATRAITAEPRPRPPVEPRRMERKDDTKRSESKPDAKRDRTEAETDSKKD